MANPPITIGELANVPAPLSPVNSPWAQDVSHRIVHRFASVAARDAAYPAAAAGNGAVCAIGSTFYVSNGTTWIGTGSAHGAGLAQSGFLIANGANATLNWNTKGADTDGYVSGAGPWTTLTIPAGLAGVYVLGYTIISSQVPSNMAVIALSSPTGGQWDAMGVGMDRKSGAFILPTLVPGDGITLGVSNYTGASSYFSGSINLYRIAAPNQF